jgi:pimeloyl-ACP methyl ester carboxylesterase
VDQQNITVGGQQIAFAQSGGSGRPVIFVHGNSSSARTWRPVMTGPFGQRFRCLAFDLPGHGSSAPARNREDYSLPGYAAVLAGFAAATQTADAVIVGWSLGGHVALEAAPAMPDPRRRARPPPGDPRRLRRPARPIHRRPQLRTVTASPRVPCPPR